MAPPANMIHASELEAAINVLSTGKPRKPPIKLSDCELKELVQFKCNVTKPKNKNERPFIVCEPVVRMLRRCAGGLSVETTAWESWRARQEGANHQP
ncbi:Mitochondrial export Som1 [Pyrenophora seminiperda CCB06]|uniref:Mitochondrial export Som1 n=1 Tax=Pyrenophora seminiperda CCB06 TaxID=1302712 RepID=A0A3M7LW53_9PLEO|nr:Mitochondrial export Som1 [Pyrenophora seminiperda CCB06]